MSALEDRLRKRFAAEVKEHVKNGGEIVSAVIVDFEYTNEAELNASDVVRAIHNQYSQRAGFESRVVEQLEQLVVRYGWSGREDVRKLIDKRLTTPVSGVIHYSFDTDGESWRFLITVTVRSTFVPPSVT